MANGLPAALIYHWEQDFYKLIAINLPSLKVSNILPSGVYATELFWSSRKLDILMWQGE
jgi:hypothetical protein